MGGHEANTGHILADRVTCGRWKPSDKAMVPDGLTSVVELVTVLLEEGVLVQGW